MKRVAILLPQDAVSAGIADPRILFTGVNEFLDAQGRSPVFDVQLVGLAKQVHLHSGVFSVRADVLLKAAPDADLIIVPPSGGDFASVVKKNKAFLPWIIDQYNKGAEVASLCVGAFLLAATGLLNGKECSTHWKFADQFREMFPAVKLVDGRIVTEQDRLYSSGGATSYWNLLLHLVEKYAGREMAILASKVYALEIDRKSQSPFAIFNGQKKHEDGAIREAQDFIENNIGEKLSVDDLAARSAIGRRHFERRFRNATHNTPAEYIQRVRVEAAKKRFENGTMNVSEVMYEVGYTDGKAFRTTFKKLTGLSPVAYRNRYSKSGAANTEKGFRLA